MAFIPSPLIFDILIPLPTKSLARFKSLNKLHHSMITDPHFINAHFNYGTNKANLDELCLIFSYIEHQNLNSVIHFLTVRATDELIIAEFSTRVSFDSYHILPSCNGLVCFYGLHGRVHVCNPSTKNIVTLPDVEAEEGFRSLSCGFGFDQTSGKYRVIQFLEPLEGADHQNNRIEVFSNDCWRSISNHPCFGSLHYQPPVFVGGFFYWITTSTFSIVSFDVGSEVFEAISPPEIVLEKNWRHSCSFYLVELGGRLCLVDLDYELDQGKRMDIWMLEEKHNWVKLATIVHQSEAIDTTRPVAFNGKEILLHGFVKGLSHLNWYNMQTGCFRKLEIEGIPSQHCQASHYVESLFPVVNYH